MNTSTPFLFGENLEIPYLVKQKNTYIILSVIGLAGGIFMILIGRNKKS